MDRDAEFYSVNNFKVCLSAFRRQLDKRGIVEPPDVNKLLYQKIREYSGSGSHHGISIIEANNEVLNALMSDIRTLRVGGQQQQQQKMVRPTPPSAAPIEHQRLDENVAVFSTRPMPSAQGLPEISSGKVNEDDYERALNARNTMDGLQQSGPPAQELQKFETFVQGSPGVQYNAETADIRQSFTTNALSPSEFSAQIQAPPVLSATDGFDGQFAGFAGGSWPGANQELKTLFSSEQGQGQGQGREAIIPPPNSTSHVEVEKLENYVSVNGFDRDWIRHKKRYAYSIGLDTRLRNVHEIQATCLLIPMEIHEKTTLTMVPKNTFVHDYGLQYPYLILTIGEAPEVYSGTNPAVRRAFAKFIYDSSYRAPNGRGYMIMRPMQFERKIFRPAPLASLSTLTLTIQKPNGTLYNNSIDDFGIVKIEHEIFNRMYLKLVLNKYFDRNEFYIGDSVIVREFELFEEKNHEDHHERHQDGDIRRLCDFMNRAEGHEVVEIGQANSEGFHNTFHILAPGVLDQLEGRVEIDTKMIDALTRFNSRHEQHHGSNRRHDDRDDCSGDCSEESPQEQKHCEFKTSVGHVINASLQNVISFKVTTLEGNVSCLGVSLIGTGGG